MIKISEFTETRPWKLESFHPQAHIKASHFQRLEDIQLLGFIVMANGELWPTILRQCQLPNKEKKRIHVEERVFFKRAVSVR